MNDLPEFFVMIGLRRHRIERRLKNLLFLPNRDRLVNLLLDLAEQFGAHDNDGIRLRIKLSHQELGNLIGSTRETVTVLLGQLRSEGSVEGGRRLNCPRVPGEHAVQTSMGCNSQSFTRPSFQKTRDMTTSVVRGVYGYCIVAKHERPVSVTGYKSKAWENSTHPTLSTKQTATASHIADCIFMSLTHFPRTFSIGGLSISGAIRPILIGFHRLLGTAIPMAGSITKR
jgi:hypothetical protein